jgi:putative nucleotidyltransferase with HDIG domain
MSAVHLRTIQALAAAIEASDETTHAHLNRVETYAVALAEALGLRGSELEAVRTAALLHDIGKLAVPQHIISKPGKLTREEFERMKTHPVVGAEILERVQFPFPVAPVVRSHHEKWDGTGYPDGLRGTNIPVGARILAVVDCLDALASDRQYRRALPIDDAMDAVAAQAGTAFDPEIVALLKLHYRDLERSIASVIPVPAQTVSRTTSNNAAPAAGYHMARSRAQRRLHSCEDPLRRPLSALVDALAPIERRLHATVAYAAIVVLAREENRLLPIYARGLHAAELLHATAEVGRGLCGWVAEQGRSILNGNARVEPALRGCLPEFLSATAIPIGGDCTAGVVAIFSQESDAFSRDDLHLLTAGAAEMARVIEGYSAAGTPGSTRQHLLLAG